MMAGNQQWRKSRNVLTRFYITGRLVLDSPAHFGNGDADALTDIPLLRDPLDGRPLLTGASIAGALRNYVREQELGYSRAENKDGNSFAEKLFGHVHEDDAASAESWLMVDDALGTLPAVNPLEIREGVAIDVKTRTAEEKKKYDIELLAAGTVFRLHFEFWHSEESQASLPWLVAALRGLEQGYIRLGMRKRRGFGCCHVSGWQVDKFAMNDAGGVVSWLEHQIPNDLEADKAAYQPDIARLLQVTPQATDARQAFRLEATFRLQQSLLVRSDSGEGNAADMIHLRNAAGQPLLPGTSLAGAIRARAYRIANTVKGEATARQLINGMFGQRLPDPEEDVPEAERQPSGSRVIVDETVIQDPILDRVQSRVKIDRFTGGAYPQALFSQQPLFARSETPTRVQINLSLRKPSDTDEERFRAEVGLLLLVLKDLWTGDLPLGGESSVGRGRLQGEKATMTLGDQTWRLRQENGRLVFDAGKAVNLESCVTALHNMEVLT